MPSLWPNEVADVVESELTLTEPEADDVAVDTADAL